MKSLGLRQQQRARQRKLGKFLDFSKVEAVNWRAVSAFAIGLAVNIYLGVAFGDSLWHTLPIIAEMW
ncbi:MAG: hypothetical protein EPN41_02930 [Candidimonas sp.]|nr:MAG: hypothetical protein EPN41_02930 [Candidimonas sp.]